MADLLLGKDPGELVGLRDLRLATLEDARRRRTTPLLVRRELTLGQAAWLARQLPQVEAEGRELVDGWGVFPPHAAEPIVYGKTGLVDAYGQRIEPDRKGAVGCLWHSKRRFGATVFRLWFAGDPGSDNPHRSGVVGPVDCYEDAIRAVAVPPGFGGLAPSLTDWRIDRLDGAEDAQ